ncbi:MAG: thioredoxin family protein [Nitrospirota bacterium]|nr:MAG: thioredoxin family protein [Nitrospirota bacterium]
MTKRKIEVFSAGCPICEGTIEDIQKEACSSCDVAVLDMNRPEVERKARSLGIRSVPAVVIDGRLADCCSGRGINIDTLKKEGLGKSIE